MEVRGCPAYTAVKKFCRKVQPPEQGAPTLQTTDRRQTDRRNYDSKDPNVTQSRSGKNVHLNLHDTKVNQSHYSIMSVGLGADLTHKPGGSLLLLSARPAVIFQPKRSPVPMYGIKLYCLLIPLHYTDTCQVYNSLQTLSTGSLLLPFYFSNQRLFQCHLQRKPAKQKSYLNISTQDITLLQTVTIYDMNYGQSKIP